MSVHYGHKIHRIENVPLQIDVGGNLREFQAFFSQHKDTALSNLHHLLASFHGIFPTETDMLLVPVRKFFGLASAGNMHFL